MKRKLWFTLLSAILAFNAVSCSRPSEEETEPQTQAPPQSTQGVPSGGAAPTSPGELPPPPR